MSEAQLRRFAALVTRWSEKINLVSRHDLPVLWERHVEDSLALAPLIPTGIGRAIDLGSGAGFPGFVLAVATGIPFTLIESDARKAAFLLEAKREISAPVTVINVRIEAAAVAPAPLVTARALAPLAKLLGLAMPLLTPDGVGLFPKGRTVDVELEDAERFWHMTVERHARGPESCVLKVSAIQHAGTPPPAHRRDL